MCGYNKTVTLTISIIGKLTLAEILFVIIIFLVYILLQIKCRMLIGLIFISEIVKVWGLGGDVPNGDIKFKFFFLFFNSYYA